MPSSKVHFCSGKGKNCMFFQSTIALGGEINFVREAENGRKETTRIIGSGGHKSSVYLRLLQVEWEISGDFDVKCTSAFGFASFITFTE